MHRLRFYIKIATWASAMAADVSDISAERSPETTTN